MIDRETIVESLRQGPCRVSFTKKDGSARVMVCTLEESSLPPIAGTSTRAFNPDVVSVFDLEAQGWRSFRLDSVQDFEVLDSEEDSGEEA